MAVAHFKHAACSQWLLQALSSEGTIFTDAELLPAEILHRAASVLLPPESMFTGEEATSVEALFVIERKVKRRHFVNFDVPGLTVCEEEKEIHRM